MTHQKISHLHLAPGVDWAGAAARLEARAAAWSAVDAVEELQLVRVDDQTGVLIAATVDRETLASLIHAVVDPWIAEQCAAEPQSTLQGETIFGLGRHQRGSQLDALGDAERCDYFVDRVVASATVWGLYGDTWARSTAAGDVEALPVWPTRLLAARCAGAEWRGFVPRPIALAAFLEQWLTGMDEDGIVAVVLPTPTHPGAIVPAAELTQALRRHPERPRGTVA